MDIIINRARRYHVAVSVKYRLAHTQNWATGESINVSSTGILFEAARTLPLNAPLQMSLLLPLDFPLEIVCSGRVVRSAPLDQNEREYIAATIHHYRFVRGGWLKLASGA